MANSSVPTPLITTEAEFDVWSSAGAQETKSQLEFATQLTRRLGNEELGRPALRGSRLIIENRRRHQGRVARCLTTVCVKQIHIAPAQRALLAQVIPALPLPVAVRILLASKTGVRRRRSHQPIRFARGCILVYPTLSFFVPHNAGVSVVWKNDLVGLLRSQLSQRWPPSQLFLAASRDLSVAGLAGSDADGECPD
ncbi:hypothetical protein MTO96_023907 [Rhipicephalus appendiculatus]